MKTFKRIYFILRLKFLYLKFNLYYILYNFKDKLYQNIINDIDSLNNYANKTLGG